MRYVVLLCNNLIRELFASVSLLKSPDGSISGFLFLLTHNIIHISLCFSTLKKSIGKLFDSHGQWIHEGNLAESMKNTVQRSSPWFHPQLALTIQSNIRSSTYKFQKINLSMYDNSQLPFMSQHYVKSTCKFQKTDVSVKKTHKIW